MTIQDTLQNLLKQSGLTQVALAGRLGVSHQALHKWLSSKATPRARHHAAIEALYLELIGGDEIGENVLREAVGQAEQCTLTVGIIASDDHMLDRFVVLITYHTNSIEGSTMTLADNRKVLLEQKVLTNRSAREQLEARNHQAALMWLLERVQEGRFALTVEMARELHQRLMNGLLIEAGEYRQHGVRIMGSRVTVANYAKVPQLMEQLFAKKWRGTLADMAAFHAEFEKIHPFSDGNGRVGRLLLVGMALASGMTPPIITRESRAAYYKYLERTQMHSKSDNLVYLLARATIETHGVLVEG